MISSLDKILKDSQLRRSKARQAVFKELCIGHALTISEIYGKTSDSLDRASLYRTLNLFRDLNIINDVVISGVRKIELSDKCSHHHHHISCSSCKKTVSINDDRLEQNIDRIAEINGFVHQEHTFDISGVCSDCQVKAR